MVKKILEQRRLSIKSRILSSVMMLVIIPLLALGSISMFLIYLSTISTLKETATEAANLAGERVSWELESYEGIVGSMGMTARLARDDVSLEDKKSIVDERVQYYGLSEGALLDASGFDIINEIDAGDRPWVKKALTGETCISDPIVSRTTGKVTVFIAGPLWEGGISGTNVVGVIMLMPQENFLNDIMNTVSISKSSLTFMVNNAGTVVAHPDIEQVKNQYNAIEDAKTNRSAKGLASIVQEMTDSKSGYGTYRQGLTSKFIAYAPVPEVEGWSIGISSKTSDFMQSMYVGIIVVIVGLAISIALAASITVKLAKSVGEPINLCAERLNMLAQGDLGSPVPEIDSQDETRILADSTQSIVNGMSDIIKDVQYVLEEMAQGNFMVSSQKRESYIGDFSPILVAQREVRNQLRDTLKGIKVASVDVATGADQMEKASQSLAEGATEQAGAIEELLATVENVTVQVHKNAEDAIKASEAAKEIGIRAQESTETMNEMTLAMSKISEASQQIGNIIASIEEIASQTNLLSLNASIEAARAGEAGRGFAVVASEIGQLANQSAQAVDQTRQLIEASLNEVKSGSRIVEKTAVSLKTVIDGLEGIVGEIQDVADSSENQSQAIGEINQGIEQISDVVQLNSATAQESSATSAELASQAINLEGLVGRFRLE